MSFLRDWSLTIGERELSGLDFTFNVKKSLKPTPNTCELKVYNLAPETRRYLETPKSLPVKLEAGYLDEGRSVLYLGEVRSAFSIHDGSEFITELSTGDSEDAVRKGRINIPVGKGMSPDQVLEQIAISLGVKQGNLPQTKQRIAGALSDLYGKGSCVSGNAARELTALCKSAGLEWSIQDGRLQFLQRGQPNDQEALLLRSDTGLIGPPSVDNKGVLHCVCLLVPDVFPGRKLSIESASVQGGFRITDVEYDGDTRGDQWYAKIHAERY